ncbi:MAG: NAD(P)H-dependent oxidoreductase subunit E [Planctomycetaceae bacterium]|nr:NAD(P)H-dependent oxidoreductase subunit E [Planctomycetaceae bacterium]MBN8599967.1 NAD(P)H-dependent oxidoreductase subunit E [Planctomycetota bacterium]
MSVLSEGLRQKIRDHFSRYPNKQAVTLPALHLVQQELKCVPTEAVEEVAELLDLAPAQIFDTLSFYGFFRDEDRPLGKKRVWICRSLPCMLRGGDQLLAEVCEKLHVSPGDTTPNGEVTIELAECLGACDGAPCILIDDELKLNVSVEDVLRLAGEGHE